MRNSAKSADPVVRLQRYLASCGVASRRHAEQLIADGRVTVNGAVARIGQSVNPASDRITVDGTVLEQERHVYLILNKPRGVVTSVSDPQQRRTVMQYVGGVPARVFPVGRLDMDAEGALLLTNDGELGYRLMHPSYEIPKEYVAQVAGVMSAETASRLAKGVELEDGVTAPAEVAVLERGPHKSLVRLVLHEGRNREVKRMCARVGHQVRRLRRASVAGIGVEGLRPGQWRCLTEQEVLALRKLAGLAGKRPSRSRDGSPPGDNT